MYTIIAGPFTPLLLPMILATLLTNYFICQWIISKVGLKMKGEAPFDVAFLMLCCLVQQCLVIFFFFNTDVSGFQFIESGYLGMVLLFDIIALVSWRRGFVNRTTTIVNTNTDHSNDVQEFLLGNEESEVAAKTLWDGTFEIDDENNSRRG